MFTTLMASAPERRRLDPSAWAVSLTLHGLVVLAVAWGTAQVAPERPDATVFYAELTDWTVAPPPIEPVRPPPSTPAHEEAAQVEVTQPDLPEGFQQLAAPEQILAEIPPPGRVELKAADFSGRGIAGGVAGGRPLLALDTAKRVSAEVAPPPVSVAVVDVPPRVVNGGEITRRMEALYPPHARMVGLNGDVVVQLVIDARGQVEMDGLTIVTATNPEFEEPSRELVQQLRWEPARRNGKPVRVWVRLPVSWSIHDTP